MPSATEAVIEDIRRVRMVALDAAKARPLTASPNLSPVLMQIDVSGELMGVANSLALLQPQISPAGLPLLA